MTLREFRKKLESCLNHGRLLLLIVLVTWSEGPLYLRSRNQTWVYSTPEIYNMPKSKNEESMKGNLSTNNPEEYQYTWSHGNYMNTSEWKKDRTNLDTDDCEYSVSHPENLKCAATCDEGIPGWMPDFTSCLQGRNISVCMLGPQYSHGVMENNSGLASPRQSIRNQCKDTPMDYRDFCSSLNQDALNSTEECVSLHDSGIVSRDVQLVSSVQKPVASDIDSGLPSGLSQSNQVRCSQTFRSHSNAAAKQNSGATFACGTLHCPRDFFEGPKVTSNLAKKSNLNSKLNDSSESYLPQFISRSHTASPGQNISDLSVDSSETNQVRPVNSMQDKFSRLSVKDSKTVVDHKIVTESTHSPLLQGALPDVEEQLRIKLKKGNITTERLSRIEQLSCQSTPQVNVSNFYDFLTEQDEDGDTLLHLAIIMGKPDVVLIILDFITNANTLTIQNNLGQTALHLAVLLDYHQILRRMVLLGAQVNVQDQRGNTPLHLACSRGNIESITSLSQPPMPIERVDCAYNVPFNRIPQDPEIRNFEGLTCLHLAASRGFLVVVNFLIQFCGADPNAVEYRAGETILHQAVNSENLELVRYLLSFPEVEVNTRRYDGNTPLQLALGKDSETSKDICDMLRDHGGWSDWPEGYSGEEGQSSVDMICGKNSDCDYDDFMIEGNLVF